MGLAAVSKHGYLNSRRNNISCANGASSFIIFLFFLVVSSDSLKLLFSKGKISTHYKICLRWGKSLTNDKPSEPVYLISRQNIALKNMDWLMTWRIHCLLIPVKYLSLADAIPVLTLSLWRYFWVGVNVEHFPSSVRNP